MYHLAISFPSWGVAVVCNRKLNRMKTLKSDTNNIVLLFLKIIAQSCRLTREIISSTTILAEHNQWQKQTLECDKSKARARSLDTAPRVPVSGPASHTPGGRRSNKPYYVRILVSVPGTRIQQASPASKKALHTRSRRRYSIVSHFISAVLDVDNKG